MYRTPRRTYRYRVRRGRLYARRTLAYPIYRSSAPTLRRKFVKPPVYVMYQRSSKARRRLVYPA